MIVWEPRLRVHMGGYLLRVKSGRVVISEISRFWANSGPCVKNASSGNTVVRKSHSTCDSELTQDHLVNEFVSYSSVVAARRIAATKRSMSS